MSEEAVHGPEAEGERVSQDEARGRDRSWIIAVLLTLALGGGALYLQHQRHGWPFYLHHEIDPQRVRDPAVTPADVPVEHDAHARIPVRADPDRLARLGVRTEAVRSQPIAGSLRAVATVVPDESRLSHVHTRVSGWVEELHVSTTGEFVEQGQPLAAIFSQELYASQLELLAARRIGGPDSALVEGARTRLEVLGMSPQQIRELERRGRAERLVVVRAPQSGVVLNRAVTQGAAVDGATELLTIADLSQVWILAEVPETHARRVAEGMAATIEFPTTGLEPREVEIDFVYPTLTERTRSLPVRIEVDNPDGALRPGVYGMMEIRLDPREGLTVPRDAIIDTGIRQHVFVATAPGRFEPRQVQVGVRDGERREIVAGLVEGEQVVASGVFLIDSESRLRATGAVGHGLHAPPSPDAPPPEPDVDLEDHDEHGDHP